MLPVLVLTTPRMAMRRFFFSTCVYQSRTCCWARGGASRLRRASRSRAQPSLHAPYWQGRSGAREDGQRFAILRCLRQAHLGKIRMGGACGACAYRHRDDPSAVPEVRRHDRQGWQPASPGRDRHDQGGRAALKIIDDAIQAFDAAGASTDAGLAKQYASVRTMRLADGSDEVHNWTIARLGYGRYAVERPQAKV